MTKKLIQYWTDFLLSSFLKICRNGQRNRRGEKCKPYLVKSILSHHHPSCLNFFLNTVATFFKKKNHTSFKDLANFGRHLRWIWKLIFPGFFKVCNRYAPQIAIKEKDPHTLIISYGEKRQGREGDKRQEVEQNGTGIRRKPKVWHWGEK